MSLERQCSAIASVPLWLMAGLYGLGALSLFAVGPGDLVGEERKKRIKQINAARISTIVLGIASVYAISYAAKRCRPGWTWAIIPLTGVASIFVTKGINLAMGV